MPWSYPAKWFRLTRWTPINIHHILAHTKGGGRINDAIHPNSIGKPNRHQVARPFQTNVHWLRTQKPLIVIDRTPNRIIGLFDNPGLSKIGVVGE